MAPPSSQAAEAELPSAEKGQLAQIADAYLQQRADAVTTSAAQSRRAAAPLALTAQASKELGGEIAALRENAQAIEGRWSGFSRAEVTVIPGKGTVSGDTATLSVEEETRLYFPDIKEGDQITHSSYVLPHTLTFKRSADGAWKLAEDETPENSGPALPTQLKDPGPINEPGPDDEPLPGSEVEGPKGEPSSIDGTGGGSAGETKPMVTPLLNYSYMISYARKYGQRGNPAFRTYGQDCTNFISQALHSGGWKETSGGILDRKNNKKWFYGSLELSTSYTWAGAENFYWFALVHSGRNKRVPNVWNLLPSDILQADWGPRPNGNINHTMMVTGRQGGMLYMTYHTPNFVDVPLDYLRAKYPGSWWYGHRT
ncbi:amidase domain-containing protein [Streptomyces sp. NPDC097619]|uniref:amidase domain-containing protein n=1 Tax=Streptomyces sp. NPDC097619 TaxID=3157228 RepID=UPI003320DAE1